ncbi:response regulator transcription factor [Metasolibacillus meyeri]|uniref:Response regulator transcription factor n=1 Tax=Metasolibacillus meyeri TaxID=1071052 RepID=A0AAW9NVV8_9BACL|nr:response regulator transcription factor [Metasolibacillus meyeri]MEC1179058.1 response regulator transcription factor [Metasolibacillus meyeri]
MVVQKILIIEDEPQIARVLQLELEFEGYTTKVTHTGTDGLIAYREEQWDLVLLDVMLPEMNGFEVLQRIRKKDTTPVILLTAKGLVEDKVTGLDLGANDYVTKPFDFEELLARIRAALRVTSTTQIQQDILSFADLSLNKQTREVTRAGHAIHLTPREYDLLVHFLKHPQHVQSREQILNAVWGYEYYGDTNVVDVYVRYLRQKIDATGTPLLHTVRGVGYVLKVASDEA